MTLADDGRHLPSHDPHVKVAKVFLELFPLSIERGEGGVRVIYYFI